MRIYTGKGDDGTTGLFYGGRVSKASDRPDAYGTVDEAQAALGLARAHSDSDELDATLVSLERDLWVVMAEIATEPDNRTKLSAGESLVTPEMVEGLERRIDDLDTRFEMPAEFVVPGETVVAAALDVARTVVRRAERLAVVVAAPGSSVVAYLNRLSDLLWMLARWQEGESLLTRDET